MHKINPEEHPRKDYIEIPVPHSYKHTIACNNLSLDQDVHPIALNAVDSENNTEDINQFNKV